MICPAVGRFPRRCSISNRAPPRCVFRTRTRQIAHSPRAFKSSRTNCDFTRLGIPGARGASMTFHFARASVGEIRLRAVIEHPRSEAACCLIILCGGRMLRVLHRTLEKSQSVERDVTLCPVSRAMHSTGSVQKFGSKKNAS